MSEGVLGRALAKLLAGANGRHYVQFPQELAGEARALVEAANYGEVEVRAVLVVEQRQPNDPRWVVPSSQLIAWRTDTDRVFVFLGGVVEPDSSFATSAGAFLTDAFPGTGGGTCSPTQLAKATMEVALDTSRPEQGVIEAFALAGEWTIELLRRVLEDGAGSLEKLGGRLLRAWAAMASDLEDATVAASTNGLPRRLLSANAREVFRLAGLPDPFGETPWPALDESGPLLDAVAVGWLTFVDRHVRLNEVNGVLTQLRLSSPIVGTERWTGLPWDEAWRKSQRFSATTPEIGRVLFAQGRPAFIPPGDGRRGDSWDAVTAGELIDAMRSLGQGGPRVSAPSGGRFLPLGDRDTGAPLLLDVRAATPAYRAARLSTMLRLDGHRLQISGLGRVAVEPATILPGGTLVVDVHSQLVPTTGIKILETARSTAGGDLEVTFSFEMTIKERPSKPVRWNSRRKLVITIEVRDDIGGTLQAARDIILSVPVIIPSPYWPSTVAVLPGRSGGFGQVAVSPGPSVEFVSQPDGSMAPAESPELELDSAANARLAAYDGRWDSRLRSWSPPGTFVFSGASTMLDPEGFDYLANARLLDQATLQLDGDAPIDVTVVRIDSHAGALPTNTLRRPDRSVPLHEPRSEVRKTPFGRFQTSLAMHLSHSAENNRQIIDSLCQLVIPSGTGELPTDVSYARTPTAAPGAPARWIGLGEGPSLDLAETDEWADFTHLAAEIAKKGLENGVPDWLSSMDLTAVGAALVRQYVEAHRRLVGRAESVTDKFWARYPFSIFLVDGSKGPERGTLQAVFLSPLHPARVAWLFSAQSHADALGGGARLLGLADGWNIPALGEAPGPGGSNETLVAVPLDPGVDGDNVPWSALIKTSGSGLVRPQLVAAGTRLPWGGRSGLNERVVAQALDDYRAAHPHASSLQIELRAAVPAPRSAEVDRAVISWVDRNALGVGGIIRVLDSEKRQGRVPSRDDLPDRSDGSAMGRFTWQIRDDEQDRLSGHVDIAFVENTAPFTRLVNGDATAPTPPLALRRFPTAVDDGGEHVDYQHGTRAADLLGLGRLLACLEPAGSTMRVVTTMDSLQTDEGVRWEVIGDINLEPAQMARLAKAATGPKQLWEWRPGWMSANKVEAVRGAHYVLARAPRSLIAGLRANIGLSTSQADELLNELGSRGIGLGTLRRPGSTQEGEAAGLFFAGRLLTGFAGCSLPPEWLGENRYAGLIPLDPIHEIVNALGGTQETNSRADLALVVADCSGSDGVRLKVTPIECKHRGGLQGDGAAPNPSEQRAAAAQVAASAAGLTAFVSAVSTASEEKQLLQASARLQTFALLVDLAMKFGPREPKPNLRSSMLQNVVEGRFSIEIGNGVAVWALKQAPAGQNGLAARRLESGVGHVEFIPAAAPSLTWTGHEPDGRLKQDRAAFDVFCGESFLPAQIDAPIIDLPRLLEAALFRGGDGWKDQLTVAPSRFGRDSLTAETANEGPSADSLSEGLTIRPGELGEERDLVVSTVKDADAAQNPQQSKEAQAVPHDTLEATERRDTTDDPATSEHASADLFLGAENATRFTVIGKLSSDGQVVALDLDHPKAIGVFGYMGSGKSYLLGALIEGAAMPIPLLSTMRSPLAVVVFNYRRNAADRFELSSLVRPNADSGDVQRLADEYGAVPQPIPGLDVLCMPGELAARGAEYAGANARELYFNPRTLDVEDWELLMGEPGSDAVFARVIRSTLQDLRRQGGITIKGVREQLLEKLPKGSLAAAEIRLEAVDRIVSANQGVDFGEILKPGRVLAIDLRQPMFNRDDAMKLILVCANQIAKQRTTFNKLVVFDEAHEYMTEAFGERFDARIRYMRHEGSSYVFATQDVGSIPTSIRRHLGTNFVFSLETRDNISDIARVAPEFANVQLQHLKPGSCYATSSRSTGNVFRSPRLISVRPRATAHGGQSRIFDGDA